MVNLRLLLAALGLTLLTLGQAKAEETLPPEKARVEILLDERETDPFEREMVLATIRSVFHVNLTLEEMTVPRMRDVDWVQLSPDRWGEERVDGRTARVMTRHMAFFPQRAGEVTIRPVTHELQITGADGRRARYVVRSEPLVLQVKESLAAPGDWWMPLGALEVSDSWNKDAGRLEDGDSAQRTVVLRALGATPQMLPPQPPMREPWLITFKPPEEREMTLTPLGPMTTVRWTWNLRPKTGEPGVLPEVQLPWYDTEAGASKMAVLAAAPFGYESFGDNAATNWKSSFEGVWIVAIGAVAGIAVTLTLLTPGARLRSRGEMRATLGRWLPDPALRAIRRAARTGDAAGFRLAAASLLRARGIAEDDRLRLLAPVDRTLLAAGSPAAPVDLPALARKVTEAAGRAS